MQSRDGALQPLLSEEGQLQAAPWTEAWGLPSEPYLVVLDAEGLVRATFEGAITEGELEDALWEALAPR
jgi:predicted transcriptional regulator